MREVGKKIKLPIILIAARRTLKRSHYAPQMFPQPIGPTLRSMLQVAATRPSSSSHLPRKCERKYTQRSRRGKKLNQLYDDCFGHLPAQPARIHRLERSLRRWPARWNGFNRFLCNDQTPPGSSVGDTAFQHGDS